MVIKTRFVLVAMIFAMALSLPVLAQRRNQQEQAAASSTPSTQIGPIAQTKPELDAFVALQNEQNPANMVTLADKFLATYPSSQLSGYVQRFRMFGLMRTGKCEEAITAGEAGLNWENNYLEQL